MVDQSIKFPAPEIKQALKTYKNLYRKMKKKAGCKDPFPTFEIIYENIDIGEAKYLTVSTKNPLRDLARTLTNFEKKTKGKRYSGR